MTAPAIWSLNSGKESTLDLNRNERNFRAGRFEVAQVAAECAQHDATCAVHVPVDDDAAFRDRLRAAQHLVHIAVP